MACSYPYIREDLLEKPNTYFYSAYQGIGFLHEWKKARIDLAKNSSFSLPLEKSSENLTDITFPISGEELIVRLYAGLQQGKADHSILKKFVKRFEVTKRIFPLYEKNVAPPKDSSFGELAIYLLASELFLLGFEKTEDLVYLNCFLKINDTISGIYPSLSASQKQTAGELLHRELTLVQAMAKNLGISL